MLNDSDVYELLSWSNTHKTQYVCKYTHDKWSTLKHRKQKNPCKTSSSSLFFFSSHWLVLDRTFSLSPSLSLSSLVFLFSGLQTVIWKKHQCHSWRILTYEWIASECVGNRHDVEKKTFSFCFRYCFYFLHFHFPFARTIPWLHYWFPCVI